MSLSRFHKFLSLQPMMKERCKMLQDRQHETTGQVAVRSNDGCWHNLPSRRATDGLVWSYQNTDERVACGTCLETRPHEMVTSDKRIVLIHGDQECIALDLLILLLSNIHRKSVLVSTPMACKTWHAWTVFIIGPILDDIFKEKFIKHIWVIFLKL